MHLHTTTVPTPVGPFTLLVGGDGVCAAGFTGRPETLQRRLDPRRRAAAIRPATDPTPWPAGCSPTWRARWGRSTRSRWTSRAIRPC